MQSLNAKFACDILGYYPQESVMIRLPHLSIAFCDLVAHTL